MVKVTFLDYGAGNIRSLRNALIKVVPMEPMFCACFRLEIPEF
jgi:imidazoleglycerol phosphate synthase glutamine amidotransferase subunit HisH